MIRVALALLFLCISASTFSQTSLPPAYEITSDTADHTELDNKFWQILENASAELTIGEVSSTAFDNRFHADVSATKGIDNALHVYWFRMRLRNSMTEETELVFNNKPYAEQFDLYIFKNEEQFTHYTKGVFISYSKRDGLVTVSTKKEHGNPILKVADNEAGIPPKNIGQNISAFR